MSTGNTLHLHVCTRYFEQIAAGTKKAEYRLMSPYWDKRLAPDRKYAFVVIHNAYKSGAENRLTFHWNGVCDMFLEHEFFGLGRHLVYAIDLSKPCATGCTENL